MSDKGFNYQNHNHKVDNEYFSFSDQINNAEEFLQFLQNDSIKYAKEENPKSKEISNPTDNSNSVSAPKVKASTPKVSPINVLLITAATTGGTVLGGVTIATSPYIDVSLFQNTSTSLVFEIKTANIQETDTITAHLYGEEEDYSYEIKESSYVSFYELVENKEYTLEVKLNDDSKFHKTYVTSGVEGYAFIEVMEYEVGHLSFTVINEQFDPESNDNPFITTTVYSGNKTYLVSDQDTMEKEYVVTNFDPKLPVFISVKSNNNGLAYYELEALEGDYNLELFEITSDRIIASNYAKFYFETNKEITSDINIYLNDNLYSDKLTKEDINLYSLELKGLSPVSEYNLRLTNDKEEELSTITFETKEALSLIERDDERQIGDTLVNLIFEANRELTSKDLAIYLNEEITSNINLVDRGDMVYSVRIAGLTKNTSYSLKVTEIGGTNALFSENIRTADELEISAEVEDNTDTEANIFFYTNRDLVDDEITLTINDVVEEDLTFYNTYDGGYRLELTNLSPNTDYVIKALSYIDNSVLSTIEFTTLDIALTASINNDVSPVVEAKEATLYYNFNRNFVSSEVILRLNDSDISDEFAYNNEYSCYSITLTNLSGETNYVFNIYRASDEELISSYEFTTLVDPFASFTLVSETELTVAFTDEAYSLYQSKRLLVKDVYDNSISSLEITNQSLTVNYTFFNNEEYVFQIIDSDSMTGGDVVIKSLTQSFTNGYDRPVFEATDQGNGTVRVTYVSGYLPVGNGDANIHISLMREDEVIYASQYATIESNPGSISDDYVNVFLAVNPESEYSSITDVEVIGYHGQYEMVIEDLNGVVIYKSNITI